MDYVKQRGRRKAFAFYEIVYMLVTYKMSYVNA